MDVRQTAGKIDALTGVRILAAAAVFLSHLEAPVFIQGPFRSFMAAGYTGVTLFFVLSGFVLAWNYSDRLATPSARAVRSFFVARLARIYPLYLCALLWAVAPSLVAGGAAPTLWLHVVALQPWNADVSTAYAFNGPGWSIGVEFFLYACFPVIILGLGRLRRSTRGLVVAGAVALAAVVGIAWWFAATGRGDLPWTDPGSAHRWLYRTPVTRLGDFVLGAVAALLIRSAQPRAWIGTVAQVAGAVSLVGLMAQQGLLWTVWSWDAAYVVPAFLLLWGLAANPRSRGARLLGSRPMVLAGEASFAFYLLHSPLLGRLDVGAVDTWPGWFFTTGLEFAMILLVAVGAHVVIERPAQRWLRRTFDRTRAAPAEDPALVVARERVLV